jgi:Flp pilus assembly protein CpaB
MMRLRLFIHRFRQPIAAASAALAVLLVATILRPSGPHLVDVVTAASDLPAGSTLRAEDVELRGMPVDYVAPGAITDIASAVGRTVGSGLAAGEVLTETRLVTTRGRVDGLHTVPVRLADAETADLLEPGVTIDLVLASGDGPAGIGAAGTGRVIAEGVRVVTVPRPVQSSGLGMNQRRAGSLIVVATDRRTAVELAAVGSQPGLGVVLR